MEKVHIEELLPQKTPFVMVDELVHYQSDMAETLFAIKESNVLVKDGVFSTSGLLENVAQTSAARIGYYYKYVLHQPVQVGFIGAIRDFNVYRHPKVGEQIHTRIHIIAEAFGMVAFGATVYDAEEKVIAKGEMKTAI